MPDSVNVAAPVRRLSPLGAQCFFGYYDVPAADAVGRHLCHRVACRDRLPAPGDVAVLGWVPLPGVGAGEGGAAPFQPFAETRAWNFQQGSLLQWLPAQPDHCLYNVFEDGHFGACIRNVRTGAARWLPLPVANVARDGTQALCVNMPRLFAFRPGYGYEETPDPFAAAAAPAADGIFHLNLTTGKAHLALSLAAIVEFLAGAGEPLQGRKVVVNHITFNPSATRFLFLLRTFPETPGGPWATYLLTAGADGTDLRHHPVWGAASHYWWRDDDAMLFYAKAAAAEPLELVLISDTTGTRAHVNRSFFRSDGHCSVSPDGRAILYDSYPDGATPDCLRSLQLYLLAPRRGVTLGRFRSEPLTAATVDLRCDLHPRWLPGGRTISFDSMHEGFRAVYWADLSGPMAS